MGGGGEKLQGIDKMLDTVHDWFWTQAALLEKKVCNFRAQWKLVLLCLQVRKVAEGIVRGSDTVIAERVALLRNEVACLRG